MKAAKEPASWSWPPISPASSSRSPGGANGVVPIDYKRAGALLADWAIWKTDGNANASRAWA